ncbi:MAG: ABC transporter permease [Alphaproteobacteria bacterium]|nr:ABC transporter permease [Alphaproteobacteria bacterium]
MTHTLDARRALVGGGGALVVVIAAFGVAALFIVLASKNPFDTFAVLFGYTLGNAIGFSEVVVRAIPLTLAGLGLCVAFRANAFNIGADGQIMVGAIVSVALGLALPGWPSYFAVPLSLLAGALAGGLYGALAGHLRARYNASEIIVTIMLNYVALQLLAWMIRGPLQETMAIFPRSDALPPSASLDVIIAGTRIHEGFYIAAAAVALVYLLLNRSALGFAFKVVGLSAPAARYGGLKDRALIVLAMGLSGGLAGLAGSIEIAGVHRRLQDDFAPSYGITAIAVALLARLDARFVPLTALLFGVLHVGSGAMQRQIGIPFPLVWIIQGIVILAFLYLSYMRGRARAITPEAV